MTWGVNFTLSKILNKIYDLRRPLPARGDSKHRVGQRGYQRTFEAKTFAHWQD